MDVVRVYDKKSKTVSTVASWEVEQPDGSIEHHYTELSETNRSKKYMRVFVEQYDIAIQALTKSQIVAFSYIMRRASISSNIALVTVKEIAKHFPMPE